jgi:hypothetical protein
MELLASLDTAEADGDDLVLDSQEDMDAFFEGVKQRGRARLAAAK